MNATLLAPPVESPLTVVCCESCPAVQRLERAMERLSAEFRGEVGYWKRPTCRRDPLAGIRALGGEKSHGWWLWVILGADTVAYRLAPRRGHKVPEAHIGPEASGVLEVDRYSGYKAMAQVKSGRMVLAFLGACGGTSWEWARVGGN